jgi:hypothetical protein
VKCPGCGKAVTARPHPKPAAAPEAAAPFDFAPRSGNVIRTPAVRRGSHTGLFVGAGLVLLLALGAGGWFLLRDHGPGKEGPPPPAAELVRAPGKVPAKEPPTSTAAEKARQRPGSAEARAYAPGAADVPPARRDVPEKPAVLDSAITKAAPDPGTRPRAAAGPSEGSGRNLIPELAPPAEGQAPKARPDRFIPGDDLTRPGPGRDGNFMLPLEVVDFDSAKLAYKVRRLKLPRTTRPRHLRLALTPPRCDDMGRLLRTLGEGFHYTDLSNNDLRSPARLRQFDVLFVTCSWDENWGEGTLKAVRAFVARGGTLYASDMRYNLVAAAFPEYAGTTEAGSAGIAQTVEAEVTDPDLRRHLGRARLPLHFDMDAWQPATFEPTRTLSFVEGTYRATNGTVRRAPLLVRFRHEAGVVVFTSFHNAKQNGALEKKLLEYLVLSLVNARSETTARELMLGAGFSTLDMQNLRLAPRQTTPPRAYRHAGGGLQVAVGFHDLGARLRLTLTAPDGRKIEHEEAGTFLVEVPAAAAGAWRFQVTAASVPFPNFPAVLAVGKARAKG